MPKENYKDLTLEERISKEERIKKLAKRAKNFKDKTTCEVCEENLGLENLGKPVKKYRNLEDDTAPSFEDAVKKIEDNY